MTSDPKDLLESLRATPPIGSWVVLDTCWCDEAGWYWSPCTPTVWRATRELAQAEADGRIYPTWIAPVIEREGGGWTTGDEVGPFCLAYVRQLDDRCEWPIVQLQEPARRLALVEDET